MSSSINPNTTNHLPQHVAFIMDGNGRWATMRGLPRSSGHKVGLDVAQKTLDRCLFLGIKVVSLYVFSTENWQRPQAEIDGLFKLAERYIDKFLNYCKHDLRVVVSGELDGIPLNLAKKILAVEEATKTNNVMTVNLCVNYGGRKEIVSAVNKIIDSGLRNVTEDDFARFLYHDLPCPDLIIRTGGQMRLSNFLLYQSAYSELFFSDTLWPDFAQEEFDAILDVFSQRKRNFGGLHC